MIAGVTLVPEGTPVYYTDSQLCVSTITQWAAGWEERGWKRKGGRSRTSSWFRNSMSFSGAGRSSSCAGSQRTPDTAGTSTPTAWPPRTGVRSADPLGRTGVEAFTFRARPPNGIPVSCRAAASCRDARRKKLAHSKLAPSECGSFILTLPPCCRLDPPKLQSAARCTHHTPNGVKL